MFAGEHIGFKFSSANFFRAAKSRPPSYFSRLDGSPYLIVGNPFTPWVSQSGFPAEVQSTSATRAVLCPAYSLISLSQAGFIDLQWPHQGAKNLIKTVLPAVSASQVSGVSSFALAQAATAASNINLDIAVFRKGLAAYQHQGRESIQ